MPGHPSVTPPMPIYSSNLHRPATLLEAPLHEPVPPHHRALSPVVPGPIPDTFTNPEIAKTRNPPPHAAT